MRESEYQAHVVKRARKTFPGVFILKNDSSYLQGVPDLSLFYWRHWAMLEVKLDENNELGHTQFEPNQEFYLDSLMRFSFARVIHPSNEEEVFHELQLAFKSGRQPRNTQS